MTYAEHTPSTPDFEVRDHGTVGTFTPLTEAAIEHAAVWFADAMRFGGAYVAERRYCLEIVAELVNEHGFVVEIDGQIVESIEEAA